MKKIFHVAQDNCGVVLSAYTEAELCSPTSVIVRLI